MTKKCSLTPYLFLTPALLVITVFVLYPIVAVVYYSFTDYSIVTPPVWVGLRNYQQLRADPIFWQALSHSFIYLVVTPIVIFLSIILAIVVNRKLPGINMFRAMYYIPVISGSIAVGISWRLMLDTNGLLNSLLISLGILKEPIQWLAEPAYTLPIAMLLTIWVGLGYYMMIFLAGLQNIPEELYDAAHDRWLYKPGKNTGTSASRACARRSYSWRSSRAWPRCKYSMRSLFSPAASAAF